jgi:hypothetical protein
MRSYTVTLVDNPNAEPFTVRTHGHDRAARVVALRLFRREGVRRCRLRVQWAGGLCDATLSTRVSPQVRLRREANPQHGRTP